MDIIQRIQLLEKHGIKPGLERITALLEYSDHPEKTYKSMIVGGTNGKGSTCAMIESMLRSAGYKTGLYTSPHLVSLHERIQTGGTMIDNTSLNDTAEKLFSIMNRHPELSDVTYFEFLTALALQYFQERHVDIAVLEVGMGGRFDATNAVQPLIATITNIAMDHQTYLGNTIEEIAKEKAGIIKNGRPFVTTDVNPESRHILETECRRTGGVFYALDRDFSSSGDEAGMSFYNDHHSIRNLRLSLQGRHQIYNAAAAIQSVLLLEQEGIKVPDISVRDGLLKTSWPGRFEIIRKHPDVIIDSAHNPAGMQTLVRTVKDHYLTPLYPPYQGESHGEHPSYQGGDRPVTVVFAVSRDKDWKTMIEMLSEITRTFIFTSYEGERSADPDELNSFIRSNRLNGSNRGDVIIPSSNALKYALDRTPDNGVIIATGSIYLIGELKLELSL